MIGSPAVPGPPALARIGRYTVLARIAQGGMAELFLAEATDLPSVRRIVVIKRMRPELARAPGYAEMFLGEARILASLNHPHIVQVVEIGQDGGQPFIAMEHIDGESLASIAASQSETAGGQPLALALGVHIVSGVLAGLHYLHERRDDAGRPLSLIHRDVSPRNVLVGYEGAVKLIDFGIARPANRPGVTRQGTVRGTVPYMSPEQCRGLLLDRRTDVFSAGILLYELVVRARLFGGEGGEFDTLKRIVEGEIPRPRAVRPDCPAELEVIILRALERRPVDRFQTAAEMLDALEQAARRLALHASARAMQAFMDERFAERRAAWRVVHDATGEQQRSALTEATRSALWPAPDESTAPPAGAPDLPTAATAATAARRRARAGLVVIAAAIVLGGAGGTAVIWRRATRDVHSAAVPSSAATPPPAARQAADAPAPAPAPPSVPALPKTLPSEETTATRPRHPLHPAAPRAGGGETPPAPGAARVGKLIVDAQPWCLVTIDGEMRGPTPVILDLPAGAHRVVLNNEEFRISRSTVIVVEPDRTVRRRFDFPISPPP